MARRISFGSPKYFDTEREAEMFLKTNRKGLRKKGFRVVVQGNALVMIPSRRRR